MAITKKTKHNNAQVKAVLGPFGIHYAKLITRRKGKFIQWLSQADYEAVIQYDPNCIEFDGVKERPTRQKPLQKYTMQRKYGNCWNTEYSFEQ